MKPALYGITHSNRDFADPYYWGKNQFNSSFPVALLCYMRDQSIPAVSLELTTDLKIAHSEIEIGDMFNSSLPNAELFFAFESRYEPFEPFIHDDLKPIDLVVKEAESLKFLRPLEIKLTTLPDNTTARLDESGYGCELVVRNPTMRYMALSFAESIGVGNEKVRSVFEKSCATIRDWDNMREVKSHLNEILEALELFCREFHHKQRPLLVQPIWKTVGASAVLAENCLDVFVWSDFALTRLFMDAALSSRREDVTRQQRSAVRLARFLYELSVSGKVYQQPIYDGMTYDTLNDKEFSISGQKTNQYMKCERLTNPIIHKNSIKEIILGGGQRFLSPERRFDAVIYFSTDLFQE